MKKMRFKLEEWLEKHTGREYPQNPFDKPNTILFEGRYYTSLTEIAHVYHADLYFIKARLKQGWSLEKAVHTPISKHAVTDHEGNKFENLRQMCDFWHTDAAAVDKRIKHGWKLKQALTVPVRKKKKRSKQAGTVETGEK